MPARHRYIFTTSSSVRVRASSTISWGDYFVKSFLFIPYPAIPPYYIRIIHPGIWPTKQHTQLPRSKCRIEQFEITKHTDKRFIKFNQTNHWQFSGNATSGVLAAGVSQNVGIVLPMGSKPDCFLCSMGVPNPRFATPLGRQRRT